MENKKRFFGWTMTDNWRETNGEYLAAASHKDVAENLPLPCKRITNDRYRQIERTGKYYRITEVGFGGKSFIYEIIEQQSDI